MEYISPKAAKEGEKVYKEIYINTVQRRKEKGSQSE